MVDRHPANGTPEIGERGDDESTQGAGSADSPGAEVTARPAGEGGAQAPALAEDALAGVDGGTAVSSLFLRNLGQPCPSMGW